LLAAKYISKAPEGKISWKVYYEKLCSAKRVYAMVVADEHSLKRLHEMFVEIKKEEAEGSRPVGHYLTTTAKVLTNNCGFSPFGTLPLLGETANPSGIIPKP